MHPFECAVTWIALALAAGGCGTAAADASSSSTDASAPLAPSDAGALSDAPVDSQSVSQHEGGLLVGYYAEWKKGSFPPASVQWDALSHVAEAFALPEADGGLANLGTFADDALVAAAHAHGVKIIASVGGARGDFYASVVAPGPRARTVAALASLCATHGYDGIDLDWEYPDTGTIVAWSALVHELRVALDALGGGHLSLSSTLAATSPNSDLAPVDVLAALDWVEVMTYLYSGPKSDEVGFLSPMVDPLDAGDGSVSETIRHLIVDRGIPASKLLLGIAFYGFEFQDGPPGTAIASPSHVIEMDDTSIALLSEDAGWTRSWNAVASAPALTDGKSFVTYEDTSSIDAKCAFVHAQGLGGAMVWHMSEGVLPDGSQPLITHAAGCR